ncbi:MAG: hypothetical protein JWQ74_1221 [Marmoricola sp.]|nr:hypothetical protein [Marmoricola sp.]
MSRATGRRVSQTEKPVETERRIASGRAAVLGIMVVGLTVAMLTVAGTTPRGIGRPVDNPDRVSLDQRTFSCTGGIAGTRIRNGSAGQPLRATARVGAKPVLITEDRTVARDAFAGQQARKGRSLAWLPCPEPQALWWFVGAGAAVNRDSVLTVTNTRTGAAVIDVDVYGDQGPVEAPGLHGITVAAGATRTFDLAEQAPALGNLAVRVMAKRGLVVASSAERYPLATVGADRFEWLPPQPEPTKVVTLAGLPARPSSSALLVVNPGQVDAVATIKVVGATGTFVPTGVLPLRIPPGAVRMLPISSLFDGKPMALRVISQQPVTATVRSVAARDIAFGTGVQTIRGTTSFAIPDGSGRLVLSSLKVAAPVRFVAYDAQGRVLDRRTVAVPQQSSVAVRLTKAMSYVQLTGDQPAVVAGFAVQGASGVASAGVSPAIQSVLLPQVRSGW